MICFNETNHTHIIPTDWVQNIFVVNHENKHEYSAKLTNLLLLILKLFSEIIIIIMMMMGQLEPFQNHADNT